MSSTDTRHLYAGPDEESWEELDLGDLQYLRGETHPIDLDFAAAAKKPDGSCVVIESGMPDTIDALLQSIRRLKHEKPEGFVFSFSEQRLADPLERNERLLVLGDLELPLAYARIKITKTGAEVGLLEAFQHGRGYGTQILKFLMDKFPTLVLKDSEVVLIPFYEKLGFRVIGDKTSEGGYDLSWSQPAKKG